MNEWDFLWGLSGKELEDAMTSGMTEEDYLYLADRERKVRKEEWEKLKVLRDSGQISK